MARYIIKITDPVDNKPYYLEWSTVVDAPVSNGMTREKMKEYLDDISADFFYTGLLSAEERLKRTDQKGCSSMDRATIDNVLTSYQYCINLENEEQALEHMLNEYCRGK